MDLSKLPRLSKTDTPADDAPAQTPATFSDAPITPYREPGAAEGRPVAGMGIEAWLSIGVGLIFLFAFPHFTQWAIHSIFHTKTLPSFLPITQPTDDGGEIEIPYSKSIFFMSDLCVAVFSYALIIEGVALILARKIGVVILALAVTGAAVLLNLYYLVTSFGEGFPIVSAIAVVFGGYMIWAQWQILKALQSYRREARAAAALKAQTNAPGTG